MEGQAQLSGEDASSFASESAPPVMAEPAADFEGFDGMVAAAETAVTVVAQTTPVDESPEGPIESMADFSTSTSEAHVAQEMEFADAISEPEIGTTAPATSVMTDPFDSGSLSEVSEFGNSNRDFGALSYTVLIEHIDTSEIRKKLSDALSDSKFQWDVTELLQRIEMGKLELTELNPAKASILVRRLQEVPVTVSWNQKLL
jgi:hypothetical protein